MDFSTFISNASGGWFLPALVIGLTEWLKSLGLKDKALTAGAMIVGLITGGGYMIAKTGLPSTFSGWFDAVVLGIAVGLVGTGIWKAGGSAIASGLSKAGAGNVKPGK